MKSLSHVPRGAIVLVLALSLVALGAAPSLAAPPMRTLTVSKTGTGTGTVTSSPAGINCGATCSARFTNGSTVTLTATASSGSTFAGWSGGGCTGTSTCQVTLTSNTTVTATFTLTTATLTVSKTGTGAGTVTSNPAGINCGATCSAPYTVGAKVTLTATASTGSTFAGWSGGGCSGNGTCQVTLNANTTVTATFNAAVNPILTVTPAANGSGTVTSNPAGIDCGTTCSAQFATGTQVTLTATPASGSTFAGWSGGGCSGTGTCQVNLTSDISVTATFTLITHTLTVAPAGTGTGTVTSSPSGIDCGATCSNEFNEDSTVTLTAAANGDSTFAGWSGACTGTGTCQVTMSGDQSVTATFTLVTHAITVSKSGAGAGSVTSIPAGIDCGTTCSAQFAQGSSVTLVANAASGSTFAGWSGGGCSGTGLCSPDTASDQVVSATFVLNPQTLSVATAGAGSGTVTSVPSGIDCGSDCSSILDNGTTVTLTATPATGSSFTGWTGACTGTGPCNLTMNSDKLVTANFALIQYTVQVGKTGAGTGNVASLPAGIDCGATCSAQFGYGSGVVLSATVDPGSTFTGWSGACTGTSPCVLSVTSDQSVTAKFLLSPKDLTVALAGSGAGAVSSVPGGIDCGSSCVSQFEAGSTVALTATPSSGSDFTGWSGACTGIGQCLLTMSSGQSVTATFTLQRYSVTVTPSGAGSGSVSSAPAGVDCGATCTAQFDYGTPVSLTAVPARGSTFAGWTGDCLGTASCDLTADADHSVGAVFVLAPHTLDVTPAGTGSGDVTSSPAGIDCGGTCSRLFESGTSVTLTATPAATSTFTGWSGACTGTGACTVSMSADRSVTASFTLIPRALHVTKAGGGSGTVLSIPSGIACGATCSTQFDDGTAVTLIAVADPGSTFAGWSGACFGTSLCPLTMNADQKVTATFVSVPRTLTVGSAGTGSGTVSSIPGGIDCGAYCAFQFENGTSVTLTAIADASSRFTGWSGACTGSGTCTLSMTSDKVATANFALVQHTLTVSRSGPGSGSVTTSPFGILCGSTCASQFTAGTAVTLTATPDAGSSFVGWTGACAGTGACQVTMSGDLGVGATFAGPHQPDGAIRSAKSKTLVGSGVINTTGSGQSVTASVERGKSGTFVVQLTNSGVQPDQIVVQAKGTQKPIGVTYLTGTTNVTSPVIAGTFISPSLAPGQSVTLTVKVKVSKTAKAGLKKKWLVNLTSSADATAKDAAAFTVRSK